MPPPQVCGSPQCLVDRLEETITKQHSESMEFIKVLIDTNMGQITREMEGIRQTVKSNGDELFTRMRAAESDIVILKTQGGLSSGFKKNFLAPVAVVVVAAAIIAALAFGFKMFDTHNGSGAPEQKQVTRK